MVMTSVGAAPATSPGRKHIDTANRKVVLATLWTVATVNYLYCDLFTSMEPTYVRDLVSQGEISGITVSQGFLLGSTVLMEIPIAMILFSRVLQRGLNRGTNIVAGTVMTIVQIVSLFLGVPTPHYVVSSAVEVACTSYIVWYAWKWPDGSGQAPPGTARA